MIEVVLFIIFGILMFVLGIVVSQIVNSKTSGRLIIDDEEDQYFVAISSPPEELVKKRRITLKVITKIGRKV